MSSDTYHGFRIRTIPALLLWMVAFGWFYGPARYVMLANQDVSLFLTTPEYFHSFVQRPGGLLEYAGDFLSQFLRFRAAGAGMLSTLVFLVFWLTHHLAGGQPGRSAAILAGVIAGILAVAMHNYYPHQVVHTLGLILAMGAALMLSGRFSGKWWRLLIVVPLLYLVGGGFVWIFSLIWLSRALSIRASPSSGERISLRSILGVTLYPAVLVLTSRFLFLYPYRDLTLSPLPAGEAYGNSLWPLLLTGWVCLSPFLVRQMNRIRERIALVYGIWSSAVAATLAAMILFSFSRRNAEFFTIEALAVQEDWDALLRYTEEHPSTNLFGTYYTNLALLHEGRLCSDLFHYPQPFGRSGICFQWDAKGEILRRGSDFFWAIGFINEAHHWAYESMVVDGITRRNLNRLIQTELVRGNTRLAEKYTGLMERTLFDRDRAEGYRKLLSDREALDRDPILGPRASIHLEHDFFADGRDLESNLKSILSNDPSVRPAFEGLMALYLLERRVDEIVAILPEYLEQTGARLPPLLDETLLVYKITNQQDNRTGVGVSAPTIRRFDEYSRILRQAGNHEEAARRLYPGFGHTFWFYLNFSAT